MLALKASAMGSVPVFGKTFCHSLLQSSRGACRTVTAYGIITGIQYEINHGPYRKS
jgi:hypothetical protein